MRITPTESETLHACLDFLNALPGVKVWRQNTGVHIVPETMYSKRRFIRYGVVGQGDIGGIQKPAGRRINIEVKRPGKKPTDNQLAHLAMITEYGGIAFWTDSIDDCMRKARECGLFR